MNALSMAEVLPSELCLALFQFLPLREQTNLARTCKRLYAISEDGSLVQLQMHRFFTCLVNRQSYVTRGTPAIRVLKVPTTAFRLFSFPFIIEQIAQMKNLQQLVMKEVSDEALPLLAKAHLELEKLQSLSLSCSISSRASAVALGQLTSLTTLKVDVRLEDQKVSLLVHSFSCLTQLTHLTLGGKFTEKSIKLVAQALRQIPKLSHLELQDDHLPRCPLLKALVPMQNLQKLRIDSGFAERDCMQDLIQVLPQMTAMTDLAFHRAQLPIGLAKVLCQMPNLQRLDLSDVYVSEQWDREEIRSFLEPCGRIPHLQNLNLTQFYLNSIDVEKAFSLMKNLTVLNLKNTELGSDGFPEVEEQFARGLMQMSCLRKLNLCGSQLDCCEAEIIHTALSQLSQLNCLQLEACFDNRKKGKRMQKLAKALSALDLHVLKMRCTYEENFFSEDKEECTREEGFKALGAAFAGMRNLTKLYFDQPHNPQLELEPEEAKALAQSFAQLTTLRAFAFNNNNMDEVCPGLLATAVAGMKHLVKLRLPSIKMSEEEASLQALKSWHLVSLKELDLSDHGIGDKGAEILSGVLAFSPSVQSLTLYNNQIGDRGVKALTRMLQGSLSLKQLCLARNNIVDEGVQTLATMLPSMLYLNKLRLFPNKYGHAGNDGPHTLRKACDKMLFMEYKNFGF